MQFRNKPEARIGWVDEQQEQLVGEPFLENLDVRVVLVGAEIGAIAET